MAIRPDDPLQELHDSLYLGGPQHYSFLQAPKLTGVWSADLPTSPLWQHEELAPALIDDIGKPTPVADHQELTDHAPEPAPELRESPPV